jgi:N-acetylglucosaminyltransferase
MADQLVVAALRVVFLLYVTLVLVHSTLERLYALRSRRQRRAEPPRPAEPDEWPAVDVVIPCFNEDPALLEACCRSVAGQDYPGPLQVWLVDDGSANRGELLGVYERWGERGCTVRLLDRNTGKRAAQDEAVRRGAASWWCSWTPTRSWPPTPSARPRPASPTTGWGRCRAASGS